jgi:hypothetical protein
LKIKQRTNKNPKIPGVSRENPKGNCRKKQRKPERTGKKDAKEELDK